MRDDPDTIKKFFFQSTSSLGAFLRLHGIKKVARDLFMAWSLGAKNDSVGVIIKECFLDVFRGGEKSAFFAPPPSNPSAETF